jgi:cellobiose-specific phosphotransferase system component IIB
MLRPDEFVVWIKGFLAATGPTWTPEQAQTVKDQADLVLVRGPAMRMNMAQVEEAVSKRIEVIADRKEQGKGR